METALTVIKKQWCILVLAALCVLGFFLRAYQYWEFPVLGETQDEFAWTFLGSSLIQKGEPTSWSYFPAYTQRNEVVLGRETYWFVTPALDHPPLFSLVPGMFSTAYGTVWNELPSLKAVRFPMLLIGCLNLFFFSLWMYRTTGKSWATVLAVFVFASAPSVVFLSRMIVSENLLLTWLLLILLFSTFQKVPSWATFLVHAFLPLTKVSGLALGVGSVISQYHTKKDWKTAVAGLLCGCLMLGVYAAYFDLGLFAAIQLQQSQRDSGLLTLFLTQLWSNVLVAKPFADIWITIGWWASFAVLFLKKAPKVWSQSASWHTWQYIFLAQLAFLVLSVGEHTFHGWYKIVFFPFFALSLGLVGQWVISQKNWLGLTGVVLLLSATIRSGVWYILGTSFFALQSVINRVWNVLAGATVLPTFFDGKRLEKVWTYSWLILLVIVIVCNCAVVVGITAERYWQDDLYLRQGIRP